MMRHGDIHAVFRKLDDVSRSVVLEFSGSQLSEFENLLEIAAERCMVNNLCPVEPSRKEMHDKLKAWAARLTYVRITAVSQCASGTITFDAENDQI